MFTGLIEAMGVVEALELLPYNTAKLTLSAPFDDLKAGESLAIDGVCLSVLPNSKTDCIMFDISPETGKLTTLNTLKKGDTVHIERAMMYNTRVGGHFLTGHVDTTLTLKSKTTIGDFVEMVFQGIPQRMRAYCVEKGAIAIDGVSLTINGVEEDTVRVMLIPHTLSQTHLSDLEGGDCVNVEFDYLMKKIATPSHGEGSQ